jgi:WD40 repeat protein
MTCLNRLARVACLPLYAFLTAQCSFADYIGWDFSIVGDIRRITDSGVIVPTNFVGNVPQPVRNQIETVVETFAVTPDLQKVYSFTNTLGDASVLAWDTATSAYRSSDSFSPSGVGDDYVDNARQPVIVGNEVFVTSFIHGSQNRQVKRYNLTSHALLETIDPLVPQGIDDIALNASGSSLYVAGTTGIYRYTKLGSTYENLLATLAVPGVDGNIAFGPDNRLYVRNFANGDVQRYTSAGVFIDTFLSHNDYPNLGTIQFGVDGNLHVYQFLNGGTNNQIRKFNPSTGSLLSSTPAGPIDNFNNQGRITYIPVPEPAGFALIGMGSVFIARLQRMNRN